MNGGEQDSVAAIVLAGGGGRRLGGVHKPGLMVGGRTLLDRVLRALRGSRPVVVVGPEIPTESEVHWTREEPPLGGPVAALSAGLRRLTEVAAVDSCPGLVPADRVLLYAGDQAAPSADTGDRLRAALRATPDADGAVLVDATGRRQWLVSCWRLPALRATLPASPHGVSLRSVLGSSSVIEVAACADEAWDIDTPEDLRRLRAGTDPDTGGRPR
ncbi:molybdenum cofactor guanylyltransferase [Actinoalloteichus hymeniacidonis]|uniref:Molybdopterin-guanine dinucleotide biosynthesis protein A n=1 Tax=Actinoalloteichus hymeniacidonis TaxID=340345 RepID=A0AAC9HPF8_9PSEU|nr:NTP transferase domain-containing protein [Actinoalloteichus hymeniacidonis]AOS62988.1 molybdopterin-guanine dinucleotide biosynthesis protein A [Actinoalloteichus hymeniacidonis]MBB5908977.1 molybdopterin-guanine dinucleotide biosynthesis protein A [Actinoalloteichus hymeniacidonis]